ncbi:MAG: hypothetical protein ACW974_11430, partial [Candidatus Thorarchaeota archaeon]
NRLVSHPCWLCLPKKSNPISKTLSSVEGLAFKADALETRFQGSALKPLAFSNWSYERSSHFQFENRPSI